jgi:hypothetical protein
MDEFGRRGFGLATAHRLAVFGGLIVGILSFGLSVFIVFWGITAQYVTRGGLGPVPFPMQTMEAVFPMLVAALAFGLTALASRPARSVDPAETRELRRAMVLLGELESKLANR